MYKTGFVLAFLLTTMSVTLSALPTQASLAPADSMKGLCAVGIQKDALIPAAACFNAFEANRPVNLAGYFYCQIPAGSSSDAIRRAVKLVMSNNLAALTDTDRMFGSETANTVWSPTRQMVEETRLAASSPGILDVLCWGQRDDESLPAVLTGNEWIFDNHALVFVGEAKLGKLGEGDLVYFGRVFTHKEWDNRVRMQLTQ